MSNYRNPFKMRASEKIESDASFLSLYSPIVLESLAEKDEGGQLWNNLLFLHSSPGAGKTSLLRIFQPTSLNTLYSYRANKNYKELFSSLKRLHVINEDSVDLLGVLVSCSRNYVVIEDLSAENSLKQRLFFALMNARTILGTLKGVLTLRKLRFPDDLHQIQYSYSNEDNYFNDLRVPCTGKELFEWAARIEEKVYDALDSFAPLSEIQPKGHTDLFSFFVLKPEFLQIENKPVCDKILFMLDDAHKLSSGQRKHLIDFLIVNRNLSNIWISERLEALDSQENLPFGAIVGRDYNRINLEDYWRRNPKKYENILLNIADKRIKLSKEIQIDNFQDCIESSLNEDGYAENFKKAIEDSCQYLNKVNEATNLYSDWIKFGMDFIGSPYERARVLKKIELFIHRSLKRTQLILGFPLSVSELLEKDSSTIDATVDLFLAKQYKIPYYFGIENLVKLSSANIEQFLNFASALFEEVLANKVSEKQTIVSAERQEHNIRKVSEARWSEIAKVIPYSRPVMKFLNYFGDLAEKETFKPNAPYAPGVTGIGIKAHQAQKLINEEVWTSNPDYELLRNVLSTCVAFNLIEIIPDISQGKKGEKWMVMFLNKWLCAKFNLPFSTSGWRPRTPDELAKILQNEK
jgi:hypothetical protein